MIIALIIFALLGVLSNCSADWVFVENLGSPPNAPGAQKQPAIKAGGALLVYSSGGELYYSKWQGGSWTVGSPLPPAINNGSNNATPSWNNSFLYYASTRTDGYGGWDLWQTEWDGTTFGPPSNLGPWVNTANDEFWPALEPDGSTLYFRRETDIFYATFSGGSWGNVLATGIGSGKPSSYINNTLYFTDNRPGGEGGEDIWLAVGSNGSFSAALNIGADINTGNDEVGSSWTADMRWMYFSSNRPGGYGGFDLYRGRFTAVTVTPSSVGRVKVSFR